MNVNEEMTADNRDADDCDLNADADYANVAETCLYAIGELTLVYWEMFFFLYINF